MESKEKVSAKIAKVFSKVEIKECTMCGKFISKKEAEQFEGVCKEHWDY